MRIAMQPVDFHFALGLEPEKAVDYFRSKGLNITWDWHDQWDEAHARAFTVAKAQRAEILQDIRRAVDAALATGQTLKEFRDDLEPVLRKNGWWGRRQVVDPKTGETRTVTLGSPRRLKTIYDTNMAGAYNAGRLAAQREQIEERPYLQYICVVDANTRPEHLALHLKVFRADDSIWEHIYPPNGFGCRCRVRALTPAELRDEGLSVVTGGRIETKMTPVGRLGEERPVSTWIGPDGERVRISPGFDHAPSKWPKTDPYGGLDDCDQSDFIDGYPRAYAEEDQNQCRPLRMVPGQKNWKDLGRPDLRHIPKEERLPDPGVVEAGGTMEEALAIMRKTFGLEPGKTREVKTPLGPVHLRDDLLEHMVEKRSNARERYAAYVLPTLENPFEVYLTEYEDGGMKERFIGLFPEKDLLVVVLRSTDGSLLWNVMHAKDKDMNKQRVGKLLWPEK